jgi:hypothetical protein
LTIGAHSRIRTGDLALTKGVLYLLSYVGRLIESSLAFYLLLVGGGGRIRTSVAISGNRFTACRF